MKVIHVHYHLRPGGVTRVIQTAVRELRNNGVDARVFSGEPSLDCPEAIVIPGLAYDTAPGPHSGAELAAELIAQAQKHGLREPLWHFHNAMLGKNPAVSEAAWLLSERGERVLLQFHDFAEEGRPANHRTLRTHFSKAPWIPQAPNVHYAALNSRHVAALIQAGGPKERVWLLPNPVSAPDADFGASPAARQTLFPGETVFLVPSRGLKRKNHGEMLLFAQRLQAAGASPFRILVTHRPEDPRWEKIIADQRLPIVLGAAESTPFADLTRRANAFLTTSVQEGFGLAFLEPWLAGKPVFGRVLPSVTDDFTAAGLDLSHMATRVPVASDTFDESAFRRRFAEKFAASWRAYGREATSKDQEIAWNSTKQDGVFDFGRLDEIAQEECLRNGLAWRVFPESGVLPSLSQETVDRNRAAIQRAYSPAAYRENVLRVYAELSATSVPNATMEFIDSSKLADAFLHPEEFFPLLS